MRGGEGERERTGETYISILLREGKEEKSSSRWGRVEQAGYGRKEKKRRGEKKTN